MYNQLNIVKRFSISKDPDQFIELWCEKFDAFMKKIKQITPETEIIINTPKFVNVGFDGEKRLFYLKIVQMILNRFISTVLISYGSFLIPTLFINII